jgi:regulation of enolase protein 1 (concanavalin A-like superfamily)
MMIRADEKDVWIEGRLRSRDEVMQAAVVVTCNDADLLSIVRAARKATE